MTMRTKINDAQRAFESVAEHPGHRTAVAAPVSDRTDESFFAGYRWRNSVA